MSIGQAEPVSRVAGVLVRLIGLLLLVAAGLKAIGTEASAVARGGLFSDTVLSAAVIPLEVICGLWFLSGIGVRAARCAAILLFSAFAVVSGLTALAGASSCGCMGAAPISPWVVALLDVGVVLTLVRCKLLGPWQPADWSAARMAGGTLTAMGVVMGVAVSWYGSVEVAMAALRNRPVAVTPDNSDVGTAYPGGSVESRVTVHNLTTERVQLVNVQSDCGCVRIDSPVWLEPKQSAEVPVTVRVPDADGPFFRQFQWVTTAGPVAGTVRGTVSR